MERRAGYLELHHDLGALKEAVGTMKQDMAEIKTTLGRLVELESERRGARRMALAFATVAGGVAGFITSLLGSSAAP